jgi:hypothetical protein
MLARDAVGGTERRRADARNRAGLVVLAYETGHVRPGWTT